MKTKMKLMLLVVAMAVIVGASMNPVSAATLTLDETVHVSYDKSMLNISVYPGYASYSGAWVYDANSYESAGVFGDGTVSGYRFVNHDRDAKTVNSYADDGTGIFAPVVVATADVGGGAGKNWASIWTTTDPGVDFANAADFDGTTKTTALANNLTGTIDITGMRSGTVYVIFGGYQQIVTVTMTMSGEGKTDIVDVCLIDLPTVGNGKNCYYVSSFDFSDTEGYDTITYHYIHDGVANRSRFIGAIIDGSAVEIISPLYGETLNQSASMPLVWTNLDPNGHSLVVDVWFGTEPNEANLEDYDMALVVDGGIAGETTVNVDAFFAPETYYWRVDNTIGDANTVVGRLLTFDTIVDVDDPPTVAMVTEAQMTFSDSDVAVLLEATVTNDVFPGSPTIIVWDANSAPGVTITPGGTDENPTATVDIINDTGSMVTVTITIFVSDAGNLIPVEASVEIDVYPDACAMALEGEYKTIAHTDMNGDCVTNDLDLRMLAAIWLDARPVGDVNVINGDFELLYKHGTTITGIFLEGKVVGGVGPNRQVGGTDRVFTFSDGSTDPNADVPGWIGYDIDHSKDPLDGNSQGFISNEHPNSIEGSILAFGVNGPQWAGSNYGALIVSDASVGNVVIDAGYELSMMVFPVAQPCATPIVFRLLANGVEITPSSSVEPTLLIREWEEISRTYDAATMASLTGKELTIVLGIDRDATALGKQTQFDNVSLVQVGGAVGGNGYINLKEFAAMAGAWLVDYSSTVPGPAYRRVE